MKLIVGLGNPGKKYEKTRHNVGFLIIDDLHKEFAKQKYDFPNFKFIKTHNAEISEGRANNERIMMVKPQTFMNESGKTVRSLVSYYKVDPEKDLLVIYDDIDLPLSEVRTTGTSAGGHKGMESIINQLGTDKIKRVRVGIQGKAKESIEDTANYVLKKFSRTEIKAIDMTTYGICSVVKEFIRK